MTFEDWAKMWEQMKTVCEAWAEILKPTMEAVSKAMRIFHDACWAAYREAGAPADGGFQGDIGREEGR